MEHGIIDAKPCAAFQNDFTTERDVLDERDFVRFELSMGIPYCTGLRGVKL